jgi:hypothetical protein
MMVPLLLAALLQAPSPPTTPPPAAAASPPAGAAARAERLEAVLGRIHGRPTPEAWRALGPEVAGDLARVALDPAALPSRRARAAEGLSWLGGPQAEAALRALVAQPELAWSVRAEAQRGAGRVLAPAPLAALLLPVLQASPRPIDRAVAAEVLAERAPAAGCGAVRARQPLEARRDRASFDGAIARCAAAGR